jgi:hypothetical protein
MFYAGQVIMAKKTNSTSDKKRKFAAETAPKGPETPPPKLRSDIGLILNRLDEIPRHKAKRYQTRTRDRLDRNIFNKSDDLFPTRLPCYWPSSESNLCNRCAEIDLDQLFSRPHAASVGQRCKDLSSVYTWHWDSCALCSLLFVNVRRCREYLDWPVELRTFSSNQMKDRR